jgi:di/tripeptidase
MEKYVKKRIQQMGLYYDTDKYGNIYCTKGDAEFYPTMVSHMDTVHTINPNYEIHRSGNNIFAIDRATMERLGVGGDDKVGVYITLELLEYFDNFKAVFFKDEEVGCVGSSQADFSFFDDSSLVLQCDRKGFSDFVMSISGVQMYDKDLEHDIAHILKRNKRVQVYGGMTDVMEIAYNNSVACANMSCGYYDPHSDNEYVKISEVEQTKEMCIDIFEATMGNRYEVQGRQAKYSYKGLYANEAYVNYYEDDFYADDDEDLYKVHVCDSCNTLSMYKDEYTKTMHCIECKNEYSYETNLQ